MEPIACKPAAPQIQYQRLDGSLSPGVPAPEPVKAILDRYAAEVLMEYGRLLFDAPSGSVCFTAAPKLRMYAEPFFKAGCKKTIFAAACLAFDSFDAHSPEPARSFPRGELVRLVLQNGLLEEFVKARYKDDFLPFCDEPRAGLKMLELLGWLWEFYETDCLSLEKGVQEQT